MLIKKFFFGLNEMTQEQEFRFHSYRIRLRLWPFVCGLL